MCQSDILSTLQHICVWCIVIAQWMTIIMDLIVKKQVLLPWNKEESIRPSEAGFGVKFEDTENVKHHELFFCVLLSSFRGFSHKEYVPK